MHIPTHNFEQDWSEQRWSALGFIERAWSGGKVDCDKACMYACAYMFVCALAYMRIYMCVLWMWMCRSVAACTRMRTCVCTCGCALRTCAYICMCDVQYVSVRVWARMRVEVRI